MSLNKDILSEGEIEMPTADIHLALAILKEWGRRGNTIREEDVNSLRKLTDSISPRQYNKTGEGEIGEQIALCESLRLMRAAQIIKELHEEVIFLRSYTEKVRKS